ncbi:MAG: sulfatase-like hydrolase/transferase [Planctomycetia bacterium]
MNYSILLALFIHTPAQATPPNFVFMFSDDQRYDALSVVQKEQGAKGRFPWFQTPGMDRIANEGVRFRNAFVVNALCSPSRACFLTGQYSHRNGIINNRTPFPAEATTYASILGQAGYSTGYIGKFHMGSQSGKRPTFGYSASFIGQGKYFDCPVEVNGVAQQTKGWIDDVSTDFAIQFLQQNAKKPFALTLGFKAPHGPFTPPERHKKSFEGKLARRTPNFDVRPPFAPNRNPNLVTGAEVPVNTGYFAAIAGVDDNVSRVLKTLDDLGLTENTVVIYSSDNGYYHGEHGLGDKRSAYEESIRIPMLVRFPKRIHKPFTSDELALNIDLAPTILDLAGLPIPQTMQGKSWKNLLEGKETTLRESFFYEYFHENPFFTPTLTAVRTKTAKFIQYPENPSWNEVYDLSNDQHETKNLIQNPEFSALRKQLENEHTRLVKELDYKLPQQAGKSVENKKGITGEVLHFRAESFKDGKITDSSKYGNHGKAVGVALKDGNGNSKAFYFDGKARIDISKSPSLDPSRNPFQIHVKMRAISNQGTIIARGGASLGYCLYISEGKPAFALHLGSKSFILKADEQISDRWLDLEAGITEKTEAYIKIDGKTIRTSMAGQFIESDPKDILQVGSDTGSPVLENRGGGNFQGFIESITITHGINK